MGAVPVTPVTVPTAGVVQLTPPLLLAVRTCPFAPIVLLTSPNALFNKTPLMVNAGITICPLPFILNTSVEVVVEVPA